MFKRYTMITAAAVLAVFMAVISCSRSAPRVTGSQGIEGNLPAWPPPPKPPRIVFKGEVREPADWGFKKTLPGRLWDIVAGKAQGTEFGSPYAVATGPNETAAITDTVRGAVYFFDPARQKYRIIQKARKTRLLSPVGVAFDAAGNMYVADSSNRRIFVYNAKGKFDREFAEGTALGRPTGLAIDTERNTLYVVDTLECSLIAFGLDGAEKWRFGARGGSDTQMNYPTHVAIAPDGTVLVNDTMNFRIKMVDPDGKLVSMFGNHGDGTGDFARPRGIAVDAQWHIYVADALFDVVQIFDRNGIYLLGFGGTGGKIGQMYMPAGMAFGKDNRLLVADQGNRRVQIFSHIPLQEEEQ